MRIPANTRPIVASALAGQDNSAAASKGAPGQVSSSAVSNEFSIVELLFIESCGYTARSQLYGNRTRLSTSCIDMHKFLARKGVSSSRIHWYCAFCFLIYGVA